MQKRVKADAKQKRTFSTWMSNQEPSCLRFAIHKHLAQPHEQQLTVRHNTTGSLCCPVKTPCNTEGPPFQVTSPGLGPYCSEGNQSQETEAQSKRSLLATLGWRGQAGVLIMAGYSSQQPSVFHVIKRCNQEKQEGKRREGGKSSLRTKVPRVPRG